MSLADHRARVGQTVEVLVEGPSKTALKHADGGPLVQLTGRTRTDHIVVFEGNERLVGQTVPVVVEEATAFTLFGTVVTSEQIGEDKAAVSGGGGTRHLSGTEGRRISLPLI
jgi:tRNA-2-methylthio-N6-dimethylallyladenosine synthase